MSDVSSAVAVHTAATVFPNAATEAAAFEWPATSSFMAAGGAVAVSPDCLRPHAVVVTAIAARPTALSFITTLFINAIPLIQG